MFVQCIWYYYPEDTQLGRTKKHHKNELFLSDLSDVNTVNSLLSPVDVVSFVEYNVRTAETSKKDLKRLYFCRYFYSENTNEFHPLRIDENGHTRIEGFHQDIDLPKNWPNSVLYTPNSVWRVSEQFRDYFNSHIESKYEIRNLDPSNSKSRFGLFTTVDLEQGSILGEFTGYVNVSDVTDEPGLSRFVHTLFEDEELHVKIDSNTAGNEFRFVSKVSNGGNANVKFVPVWLESKWLLLVVTIAAVEKGQELLADFGTVTWTD